jgi:hypothetical protein
MANDRPEPNSTARGGPRSDDPVLADQERDRNALHRQGQIQASAETEDPHRAVAERTGNAERAEAAAGGSPDADNRPDADRAYQESRGDRAPRDGRVS